MAACTTAYLILPSLVSLISGAANAGCDMAAVAAAAVATKAGACCRHARREDDAEDPDGVYACAPTAKAIAHRKRRIMEIGWKQLVEWKKVESDGWIPCYSGERSP